MEKSRLSSHLKKQARKNVVLVILGVIAFIALLIVFGTQLLIGFSLLLGKFTGNEEPVTTNQSTGYIAPPILDTTFEATNSAEISLKGTADKNNKVNLYRNGKLVDKVTADSDAHFIFTNVPLEEGDNRLKAKVVTDKEQSAYSNEIVVKRLNKEPTLEIAFPAEGDRIKKESSPIKVTGQSDPGVRVTVNDFRAIVDSQGRYSYTYTLRDGENVIKVVATDSAGNQKTKEVKIQVE